MHGGIGVTGDIEIGLNAGEMAAAVRARGALVANMSHLLRTPLNSILGFARLMQHGRAGAISEQQREYLGDIVNSGNHLLALINDVIELSKLDAGSLSFRPELVDVPQQVGEVVRILAAQSAARSSPIAVDVAGECTGVWLDPAKLKQVLFCLLDHLLETGGGGPVRVRVRQQVADTGVVRLRFELDGPRGELTADDRARFFYEGDGDGLRLVLARRLVERQGGEAGLRAGYGEVTADSAAFYFELPCARPASAASNEVT
jgi:signal transduction histidine kinase